MYRYVVHIFRKNIKFELYKLNFFSGNYLKEERIQRKATICGNMEAHQLFHQNNE